MESSLTNQPARQKGRFGAIATSYFMGLFNDNFYKEAALILAVLQNNIAIQSLAAAVFTVSYMLGAAPGGWLADRHAKGLVIIWAKAVELLAMIGLAPYGMTPRTTAWMVIILIAATGIAGGIILVPLESFIQIRPAAHLKGRVIAAANFAVFSAMTVGAFALYLLNRWFRPTTSLGLLGVATALFTVWLAKQLTKAGEIENA